MDEAALQDRLHRIERQQYLILVLLIVPYLFLVAEFVGYWIAGVTVSGVGVVVFALIAFSRREARSGVDG